MSLYSYFSLSSKRSELICAGNAKKRVFCDSDVLKKVLKFQIFSDLKTTISCAQACGPAAAFRSEFVRHGFTVCFITDTEFVCPSSNRTTLARTVHTASLSYETRQLVSFERRESLGMSNLPFSSHCQAQFDRLHLFWCSTSEISWS